MVKGEVHLIPGHPVMPVCTGDDCPVCKAKAVLLLHEAADLLRDISLRLIAVRPQLDVPYLDRPELTPWANTIERRARRAHDLSVEIRKQLADNDLGVSIPVTGAIAFHNARKARRHDHVVPTDGDCQHCGGTGCPACDARHIR